MSARIPFFQHDLGEEEIRAFATAIADPILTTGATVDRFEREFASLLGRRYALGVTSCTGALHMSLLALGIGPGDEVITTPMTFIATATAIVEAGAKPVFVDVEPDTGNLDAARLEAAITPRTRAIIPVHLYGLMCDMRAIKEIARRHDLAIVEDAAHCVEGERDGVRPGELGDTACFSFFATKNLTCGEGGAVVTDDARLYERLKLLRTHGMNKTSSDRFREGYRHWDMLTMGWKYNLPNLHAAILLPQMERLWSNHRKREELAALYEAGFQGLPGVRVVPSRAGARHARHLFPIRVGGGKRDSLIGRLQEQGIATTVNYRAIHLLTYFAQNLGHRPGDFPVAEKIGEETVSLPFYPNMPHAHVHAVVDAVHAALG